MMWKWRWNRVYMHKEKEIEANETQEERLFVVFYIYRSASIIK
jgi:hypothetical protein